jgi:Fe-S oxidoreductase
MYNPLDIIALLAANVAKTRSPLGVPKFMVNRWWRKEALPRRGEWFLFTGLMYQFVPYIEKSTAYLARFEDTRWEKYLRFGTIAPRWLSGIGLSLMTKAAEKRRADRVLKNIAKILRKSAVDFFYDSDLDEYSGILLYDLGDQDSFVRHAHYVAGQLKKAGIQKVITVDPHTTYALKVLYPKITGIAFEVKAWFELVDLHASNGNRRVTLHDPCFYGRYLNLSDVPGKVLAALGIDCVPVRNSGEFTNCCGGPAESVSPKLSGRIAEQRLQELPSSGEPIIAMCPICLGNLKRSGANVEDLSTLIAQYVD